MWGGVSYIKKLSIFDGKWIVLFLLAIGAFIRYLYLLTPGLDSDQAVIGLMAKHILQGELPVFYYGQPYLGSLEAFWVALNFKLFGISTFVLDMSIAEISILYFVVIYLFSSEIFGRWVGVMVLAYVVFAPFYLSFHYVLARGAYIELLVLGTLLLWLIYRMFYKRDLGKKLFGSSLLLGFLCGVIWWLHPMGIYYIATAMVFVMFSGRRFLFTRYMIVFVVMFFVGSLPFWIWHAERHFYTLNFLFSKGNAHYWNSFLNMWTFEIPVLLGFYRWLASVPQIPLLSKFLFILFVISVFWQFSQAFRYQSFGDTSNNAGRKIVVVFVTVVTLVYMSSGWGEDRFPRHLIPIFSAVPILIASFLYDFSRFSRVVSTLIFFLLIGSNVYSCYPYLFPLTKRISNYDKVLHTRKVLFDFLESKDVNRVYAPNYWLALKLTFESNERIIFSSLHSRYLKYTMMADTSVSSSYLFRGKYWYDNFARLLKRAGFSDSKRRYVAGYTVYYDFNVLRNGFVAVRRERWEGAFRAFDGDIYSRWKVVAPVKRESSFILDIGSEERVGMIRFVFPHMYAGDLPSDIQVYFSTDMKKWDKIDGSFIGFYTMTGKHLYYKDSGFADFMFPQRLVRYVKFVYVAGSRRHDWSIPEVFLYRKMGDSVLGRDLIASRERVLSYVSVKKTPLFLGDYFTATAAFLRKKVVALCYGNRIEFNPSKGRFYVEYESYRWKPLRGDEIYVLRKENLPLFEDMLNRWEVKYVREDFGNYIALKLPAFGLNFKKKGRLIKPEGVIPAEDGYLLMFANPVNVETLNVSSKLRYLKASVDGKNWVVAPFLPEKLYWINGLLFTAFGDGEKSYLILLNGKYRYWKVAILGKPIRDVHIRVKGNI